MLREIGRESARWLSLLALLAGPALGCAASGPVPSVQIPDTADAQAAKSECDHAYEKCAQLRAGRDPTYCDHALERCYNGIPGSHN